MSVSSDRPGLTLVEVVVAMAVVGLVLAFALGAASAEMDGARRQADALNAAALAPDLLGRVALADPTELAALADSEAGRFDPPFERYAYEVFIELVPEVPGLYDVYLRVSWPGSALEVRTRVRPREEADR